MKKKPDKIIVTHRRKVIISILSFSIGLSMCACQKTPKESIVKEKDFDKMIEQAQKTEEDTETIPKETEQMEMTSEGIPSTSKDQELYHVELIEENKGVSVKGDAVMDIPQVDQYSIVKVKRQEITQEMVDRLLTLLAPDETWYDGEIALMNTKADIEKEIQFLKDEITQEQKNLDQGIYTTQQEKQQIQESIESTRQRINDLQEQYRQSPAEPDWNQFLSDGKIRSAEELYALFQDERFKNMAQTSAKGTSLVSLFNDGKSGECISIYAQNSPSYGNCLRFRKCRNGYITLDKILVGLPEFPDGALDRWEVAKDSTHIFSRLADKSMSDFEEFQNETDHLTEEEAKATAGEFLEQMALNDYSLYTCQLCYEIPDINFHQDSTKYSANGYRKLHVITYLRNYNGVPVNNLADIKYKEGETGGEYVKKFWPAEQLILYVNDDGVVGMDLNAPLVLTEVTVDHSNVKSFEEIRKIFEQMVVIANVTENGETIITVEKVSLGYTMISAKDDFEHGYIVPVWDFRGEIRKQYELFPNDIRQDASILTINAIDGTIIDRELGY